MTHSTLRSIGTGLILTLLSSCGGGIDPNQAVTPKSKSSDGGSVKERQMAALARGHSKQKRKALVWDPRLAAAAQARAKDMGMRRYFDHVDPDGRGPNWHASKAGYPLPLKWTAFEGANQIESILAGNESTEAAFKMWMGSPKHVSHILGLTGFYQNQTRYGIGYAHVPGSPFKHYWVFLSAPPEE